MAIDMPDKIEYTTSPTSHREDVAVLTLYDLQKALLAGQEVLFVDPITLVNKTDITDITETTLETMTDYYQVIIRTSAGILTQGLFSKKLVDQGQEQPWTFYHAGGSYTLLLQKDMHTGQLQAFLEKQEKKETVVSKPITSLSGLTGLPVRDYLFSLEEGKVVRRDRANSTVQGEVTVDQYAAYIDQPRSVYKDSRLIFDATGVYTLSLQFFGNQRATLSLDKMQTPLLGVHEQVVYDEKKDTRFAGITTKRLPYSKWNDSKIQLLQGGKEVGVIDFSAFTPAQKNTLGTWYPLRDESLSDISGIQAVGGKPTAYTLSCEKGMIRVHLASHAESGEDIMRVRSEVIKTQRTIGTWVARPVYADNGTVASAYVELVGVNGVKYIIDAATIKKLGKPGSRLIVKQKLQNNTTYQITLENMHDELHVALDQLDNYPDGGMDEVWEEDKKPLPEGKKPPQPEPEKKPKPEQQEEDDHEDEGHEEKEPEVVVVNPWEKKVPKTGVNMLLGGEEINGYYSSPRLLPGSAPLDLASLYMEPGKGFVFKLRKEIDRWPDGDIVVIPLDQITLGTISTIRGEDGQNWQVRVDVYNKKLGFSFKAPGGKNLTPEMIDGVPVLYNPCYPEGKRMAGIKVVQPDGKTVVTGTTGTSRQKHGGLDIAGPKSTDILACTEGEVVYVHDGERNHTPNDFPAGGGYAGHGTGYGNTIVIMHPGGYFTSYHHLSPGTLKVKPGDKVTIGQPIAKMGNSGQVWSSRGDGTHLHLGFFKLDEAYIQRVLSSGQRELFLESKAKKQQDSGFWWLDPEDYLRDGYAPTGGGNGGGGGGGNPKPNPIPEVEKKTWDRVDPPKGRAFPKEVIGNTPQQRVDAFLTYMGYKTQDIEHMHQLADQAQIDHALIPAIIRAEHGKGPPANNNPGNVVGINPTSLKEGLTEMAKVFNNPYQSKNTTIGSLSGYGRRLAGMPPCTDNGQYCYAMDTKGDWHINVTNFMSFVYNTKVDHTYAFRRKTGGKPEKTPEYKQYLMTTPKTYVGTRLLMNGISYNAYMPKLSPMLGQNATTAPWGWLVRIDNDQPMIVTPTGVYAIKSNKVVIENTTYAVTVKLNTQDPVHTRAAQFTLRK